jgi:hypothetical protein
MAGWPAPVIRSDVSGRPNPHACISKHAPPWPMAVLWSWSCSSGLVPQKPGEALPIRASPAGGSRAKALGEAWHGVAIDFIVIFAYTCVTVYRPLKLLRMIRSSVITERFNSEQKGASGVE